MIVQALDPDAEPARHAAAHDADGFLAASCRAGELLAYPPYGHLIRVVFSSTEPGPELAAALCVPRARGPRRRARPRPGAAVRRQGRHRTQLVVRSPEREAAIAAVRAAVEQVASERVHGRGELAVDVDPQ